MTYLQDKLDHDKGQKSAIVGPQFQEALKGDILKGNIWKSDFALKSALDTCISTLHQDHGKGGLSLRGVAVMTETATTAETRQNRHGCLLVLCIL